MPDVVREYIEVHVLRLKLRPGARLERLVELVHRAVPYPVVLAVEQGERPSLTHLSLVHKRWSQGETGRTVLDGEVVSVAWDSAKDTAHAAVFLEGLPLERQPTSNLHALYQGWIDLLLTLQAARRTGTFSLRHRPEEGRVRREALRECARLDEEIDRLRSAARNEKQVPRLVELNLELRRAEAARVAALKEL